MHMSRLSNKQRFSCWFKKNLVFIPEMAEFYMLSYKFSMLIYSQVNTYPIPSMRTENSKRHETAIAKTYGFASQWTSVTVKSLQQNHYHESSNNTLEIHDNIHCTLYIKHLHYVCGHTDVD